MKLLIEFASYFLIIFGGVPLYLGMKNNDLYFLSFGILILTTPIIILLTVKRRRNASGEKQNVN